MSGIDWRSLYAANQEAIARAGVGRVARPSLPERRAPGWRPALPGTARTTAGRRADAAGARVHVPPGLDRQRPAALVLMLHGCTQDPASFAAATRMDAVADREGFVVAYPAQPRSANPGRCWNWFEPEHQRRGGGEPAAIAALARSLVAGGAGATVDPARVFVAGLSSGAAMAAVLGACYPDLVAAVGVHSGLAYRAASGVGAAFAAMARGGGDPEAGGRAAHAAMGDRARAVPTMVVHGTADRTVAPVNAREALVQAMTAGALADPDAAGLDPARPDRLEAGRVERGRAYARSTWTDRQGRVLYAGLEVEGLGHAWSGGAAGGSHTDPSGPDASAELWRFFAAAGRPAG
jgi:poly(hydroxyalkanoate) depolymerase family esterase